jgi:hypothetical protein
VIDAVFGEVLVTTARLTIDNSAAIEDGCCHKRASHELLNGPGASAEGSEAEALARAGSRGSPPRHVESWSARMEARSQAGLVRTVRAAQQHIDRSVESVA